MARDMPGWAVDRGQHSLAGAPRGADAARGAEMGGVADVALDDEHVFHSDWNHS